jgi:hypothetical protein
MHGCRRPGYGTAYSPADPGTTDFQHIKDLVDTASYVLSRTCPALFIYAQATITNTKGTARDPVTRSTTSPVLAGYSRLLPAGRLHPREKQVRRPCTTDMPDHDRIAMHQSTIPFHSIPSTPTRMQARRDTHKENSYNYTDPKEPILKRTP